MNNSVLIATQECEIVAREAGANASLEDRARAAMYAAKHHWLVTDEDDQFTAACEGLARAVEGDDFERVKDDFERLHKAASVLAAMTSGVPVDFDALEIPEPAENPLGLKRIWLETR